MSIKNARSHKPATESLLSVLVCANNGTYKLPKFQRDWKWSNDEVKSLFESLRLGYPIGSFLSQNDGDLAQFKPVPFHGISTASAANPRTNALILDGQQRITAAMNLCFGLAEDVGHEFYIDINKLKILADDFQLNIAEKASIFDFSRNVDLDNDYIVAKPFTQDREKKFLEHGLIWTPLLTADYESELFELVRESDDKTTIDFVLKVVKKYFAPAVTNPIPVIQLSNYDVSAVAKVFTTMNSSGKSLSPFELVVASLFPDEIILRDDLEDLRNESENYAAMDKNGEILLQTIAMIGGRSPKKSDLPKNVTGDTYTLYKEKAATSLDIVGDFLRDHARLPMSNGQFQIPYDAIYAPMATVAVKMGWASAETIPAAAKQQLLVWLIASALSQRYQEGVHNKQDSDAREIIAWINEGKTPEWISNTEMPLRLKQASTSGAHGKLMQMEITRRLHTAGIAASLEKLEKVNAYTASYKKKIASTFRDSRVSNIDSRQFLNQILMPKQMLSTLRSKNGKHLFKSLLETKDGGDWEKVMKANFLANNFWELDFDSVDEGVVHRHLLESRLTAAANHFGSLGFSVASKEEKD